MEKPVISVIMPAYKSKETIQRAIDSFINQDICFPCELIIGFKDAKDGTLEIAKEYANKYPCIKICQGEEQTSMAMSRHNAILESKGDYIYFMDSDDELRKDCLSTLLTAIRDSGSDCVNASFYEVYDKKVKEYAFAKKSKLDKYQAISALFRDISFRGFLWTKIWKREVFEKRPLLLLNDSKDIFEDIALCVSLLSRCDSVSTIKEPVYYYYKNIPTSATTIKRTDRAMRHMWVFALARHYFETIGDPIFIRMFKKHAFRSWLSIKYDLSLDKKYGATKEYVIQIKNEWRDIINIKKPLPLEGRSYSDLLKRAWLY